MKNLRLRARAVFPVAAKRILLPLVIKTENIGNLRDTAKHRIHDCLTHSVSNTLHYRNKISRGAIPVRIQPSTIRHAPQTRRTKGTRYRPSLEFGMRFQEGSHQVLVLLHGNATGAVENSTLISHPRGGRL